MHVLLKTLPYHIKNLIRQLERLYRKIINNNYSQDFNKTCMHKRKTIAIILKCVCTSNITNQLLHNQSI